MVTLQWWLQQLAVRMMSQTHNFCDIFANFIAALAVVLSCIRLFFVNTASDIGHVDFLEKAHELGDYVIVGIHSDPVSDLGAVDSYCFGIL